VQRRGQEAVRFDRLLDREHRRKRLEGLTPPPRPVRAASTVSPSTEAIGCWWNMTSVGNIGSSWRVGPVFLLGHIVAGEDHDDTRHAQRPRHVEGSDERVGVWRADGPRMQQARKLPAQIVDVTGVAGDVSARALVRQRPARDPHGRSSH
jgi:hypothetical protein